MRGLTPIDAPAPFELWLADLQSQPNGQQLAALSGSERERAARFVFPRDQHRYLAAHCALRYLLAARTAISAELLEFHEGPFGKPSLGNECGCAFNMSHSEDVALIAIADAGEIGVDVEMLRPMPDAMALAQQNFSAAEYAELAATEPENQALAFLLGWTRKEACLKAIGSGLSIAPQIFTAGLSIEPRTVGIATPNGAVSVQVYSFQHGTAIVGSLAHIDTTRR
jgi:4'-phosphopantetheinyl transferase